MGKHPDGGTLYFFWASRGGEHSDSEILVFSRNPSAPSSNKAFCVPRRDENVVAGHQIALTSSCRWSRGPTCCAFLGLAAHVFVALLYKHGNTGDNCLAFGFAAWRSGKKHYIYWMEALIFMIFFFNALEV